MQDSRARLARRTGRARLVGIQLCPRRAFLACLALHAPRSVALADFFSILLQRRRGFSGGKRLERHLVGDLGETRAAHTKIGKHLL